MAENVLVKFDLNTFRWTELPSKDGFARMLGGGEVMQDAWNRFHKGEGTLFFGVYVDVLVSISEAKFEQAACDAWSWLRFQVPTIASTVDPTDDGMSRLVYKLGTDASVAEWASRTFTIVKRPRIDIDAFRVEVGRKPIPSSEGDQTFGYLLMGTDCPSDPINKFGFLLHTHHAPYDGAGLKIIVNMYLTQLVKNLALLATSPSPLLLPWGSEEPSFAHPYYGTLGAILQILGEGMNNPYGFKPRTSDPGLPTHAREEIVFTVDESSRILNALKLKGASDNAKAYTVSHLAHAALAMATIADNPPSAEASSQFLNNQHLRDCRVFLTEPYSSRFGYPGYALGVGGIRIPVSLFLTADAKPSLLDKSTLVRVMKAVRDLYAAQKALPDPISYMGLGSIGFAQTMIAGFKANMMPPNNCYSFSSDGVSEKWLDHEYPDSSGTSVFSLRKFVLSLNRTEPSPFFRVTSWRGALELSADFNANLVSADEVKVHLNNWKKFILLALEMVDD
ncbi:hypothetical protein ONZ45_g7613 [Pleurotus djamor]|nr:hypothetical protein ONZ45_g7613 [Pleurotus djamor]